MPHKITESKTVHEPLLCYAEEAGWTRLDPYDCAALRGGRSGLLLHEVFVQRLQQLNPSVVDTHRAEDVAKRLSQVPPTIEGNLQAWEYLCGLRSVYVPEENRERDIHLLDPDHLEANVFHVTSELAFENGRYGIRPDIGFFVNGVPVLMLEAKSPTVHDAMDIAFKQVCRYHREGPELCALLQLQSISNLLRLEYAATWVLSRKYFFDWRTEATTEETVDFETSVKSFVAPRRILRMLTQFLLFARRDDELTKVVLRPHQMRAVERCLARARDEDKRRGLVWHTQGSGKTYTMIALAKRLVEDPDFQNPTVLMLVDRNELETQLFQNLDAVQFGHVTFAGSKRHLRHLLRQDQRGLLVSMIHKFDDIPEAINSRENIFVLVDEAHRTTGGDLGNYLMGALPNAQYLGFTGTPIDQTTYGAGTFKVFGRDDEQGYLDKYSIADSIRDGTTVPLHYALASNDLLVDRETLNREFLDLADLWGVSDPDDLNRVLDRAVTLKNMLKNEERVRQVAAHIAHHFCTNVQPMGYKAFVVAVDREACAMYKAALDEYLAPECSTVVYSAGCNDHPFLARHHLTMQQEKDVRNHFRRPGEQPQILIVTDKLLTGFDAPILYCMYLDKPMRDHTLLQAIARVNRPYGDEQGCSKSAGLIYDFVGIFENLKKALAFDSHDVEGLVVGLDVLMARFSELMTQGRTAYLAIWAGLEGDKAAEAVLDVFRDGESRAEFLRFFRELQDAYEILSPDAFLRPYLEDYQDLGAMYYLVRNAYDRSGSIDSGLMHKTEDLVQQHTRTTGIVRPDEAAQLDADLLDRLAGQDTSDTVKVFNLLKNLTALVDREAAESPHLVPIGERAERIAEAFEQRLVSAQEAVARLQEEIVSLHEAIVRRGESELSREGFGVYWLLRSDEVSDAEKVAKAAEPAFQAYPHWRWDSQQESQVRIALYKALKDTEVRDRLIEVVDHVMKVLQGVKRD